MKSLFLSLFGLLCWSWLLACIAFRLGDRYGFRRWKANVESAYAHGVKDGRRQERGETEGTR